MINSGFAWLVGWLEGEGTFYCSLQKSTKPTRKDYKRLTVRACSVDLEVCEQAQLIAGGRIYGPYKYDEIRQPHYQWSPGGTKEELTTFMQNIKPYMSTRRQIQIENALERIANA